MTELAGVIVPLITPVDEDDRVDENSFRKHIRHLSQAGVHGLFVGGSAGEGPLLTVREWGRMVEIAFDENRGAIHLLGGVSDTSTERVKEKIRILAGIGYTHFVVTPTFYIALKNPGEYLRLFGACKEAAPEMEMIAYNIPGCTQSEIPVAVLCDMARRGWIRHCKESSGNLHYFRQLLQEAGPLGLRVLMGDEGCIAEGLLAGACGIVPVCANYEPATFIRAYEASLSGNEAELRQQQERMLFLREELLFQASCWIAGAKYAVTSLGIGSGKPVSPLEPLNAEQRARIEAVIRRV